MRRLPLLLLAALAVPALAQAPADADVVLYPGHPDLMTSALTPADDQVMVRTTGATGRQMGTLATTYVAMDGGAYRAVYAADVPQMGGQTETTVTFAWPSLAPTSRTASRDGLVSETTYDGADVSGQWARGEWDPIPYDITLPRPVFAPETVSLVARALPLRAGYAATVPTFTAEDRIRDYTLSVIGEEEFTRADGSTVMAWAIERTSSARGDSPRRYLVDGETRDLVATTRQAGSDTQLVTEPVTEAALEAMNAQTPAIDLRPGLDRLATDALADYSQTWTVKLVEPQQQDIGTLTRSLTIDRAAGTVTMVAETNIAMAGQVTTETAVAAYPSLEPISTRIDAGETVVEMTYDGLRVTGTRTAGGETTDIDLTLEAPAFGPALAAEVVRLVPFEEGFRGTYHTVSPTDGATEVEFVVGERQEVMGRDTWSVSVVNAPGVPAQVFSIDAETREVVRIRLEPQMGVIIDFVPAE